MSVSTDLVVFRLFDLHIDAVPVAEPDLVSSKAAFLYRQQPYGVRQERRAVESLGPFTVRPVTRELQHDYFWRSYFATRLPDTGSEADAYWQILFPFRLTPKDVDLRFVLDEPQLDLTVGVEILLWPTGWSSNLAFSVGRSSTLDEAAGISQAIRNPTAPAFRWNKNPATLSTVFRNLSQTLRGALFTDPDAVYGSPRLPRFAVSLVASSDPDYPPFSDMSGSDRSRLHSILRGEEVEIAKRIAIEKAGRLLVTQLSRGDFALTDLDRGVLVSAANAWTTRSRTVLKCLASNVRKSLVMAYALGETAKLDAGPGLKPLREGAIRTLRRLPHRYNNPVFHSFLRTHAGFARQIADGGNQPA